MNIQWFPGHMAKTRRQISDDLKLVDIIYELVDARLPLSSRNPEIDTLSQTKPKIIILNKCDLSDDKVNNLWLDYFRSKKLPAVLVSSNKGLGLDKLNSLTKSILSSKTEQLKLKGIVGRGTKVMIVGIPNVGKSSLINKLAGRAGTKTADKPGVTRAKQWISIKNGYQLLDTPGILWPKFEDENVGLKLAFSGAIKDEIIDIEELSIHLIEFLKNNYPESLLKRYNLISLEKDNYDILKDIGSRRGCMISGGDIDTHKAAIKLLDEFRGGILGKISLESPEDQSNV